MNIGKQLGILKETIELIEKVWKFTIQLPVSVFLYETG